MEECVGKSIWHSGNIPKASGVEIVQTQKDKDGQILNCIIKFEDDTHQLINIYAPTKPGQRKLF